MHGQPTSAPCCAIDRLESSFRAATSCFCCIGLLINFSGINRTLESIAGITDEATARETLPQINALQQQFSGYSFDKMPHEAPATLRRVVGLLLENPLLEKLQAAIELAYKIPGVKEILEPATDGLMKTVSAFTKSA